MFTQFVKAGLALGVFCLGVFAGGVYSDEKKPEFSGFLGDYSGFVESDRVKGAWVYAKPGLKLEDLKQYNKVILEPVQVYSGDAEVFKDVDQDELDKAAKRLHDKIAEALGSDYPQVTEPGADVLRIRIALTGAVPRDREYGVMGYIPVALVFRAAKAGARAVADEDEIRVEATMEAEFIDSVSHERLMAAVDSHQGEAVTVDEKDPDIKARTMDEAFEFWGETIKRRLDEAHGIVFDVDTDE